MVTESAAESETPGQSEFCSVISKVQELAELEEPTSCSVDVADHIPVSAFRAGLGVSDAARRAIS